MWDVAVDGAYSPDATLSAQYDNIVITNGGSVVLTVYSDGAPQYSVRDFSSGSANANLLYGPVRRPGTQIGAHFFYWYDAPDNNADASFMAYHPYGLKNDPWVILDSSWFVSGGSGAADGRYQWGTGVPTTYGVGGYYVSEIMPGFDNRPWSDPGVFVERYDGGQMVRWFNSKPSSRNIYDSNLILVETWNELWEGTALQRCKDYPASSPGRQPATLWAVGC